MAKTKLKGQVRQVRAHENLILHTINEQAGTLGKAILESVMNSVEAGSPVVDILFDEHGAAAGERGAILQIVDKGKGFKNRWEIENWFETFGTPHTDSEGKTWAKFRMGRGQGFSYARNEWRTGKFRMIFDLKTLPADREYQSDHVLDYYLEESLAQHKGTSITMNLYKNPIGHEYPSVDAMKSAIKTQVEFMSGVVISFNGEQINTPPETLNWDDEDEYAYYLFGKGRGLTIYNLGAYVKEEAASTYGVRGVIVSKLQLKVNFARNAIMVSDCDVYREISKVVRANREKKVRGPRMMLDTDERMSLLHDFSNGVIPYSAVATVALIRCSNDRLMTLNDCRKIRQPWTFAPHADQRADRIMWRKAAVCFDEDLLNELDYSGDPKDFFLWLLREEIGKESNYGNIGEKWEPMRRLYAEFLTTESGTGLADGFNISKTTIPEKDWTKAERRLIKGLSRYGHAWKNRTLMLGQSETALAWTDGVSYIALDRGYLKNLGTGHMREYRACHLVAVLLHETAHDDSTEDTHHHGMEFYKLFHDIVSGSDCSYKSPMGIALILPGLLRELKAEEETAAIVAKEKKQEDSRKKALGITAKPRKSGMVNQPKIDGCTGIIFPPKPVVRKPELVSPVTGRPRKRRRF